ncbi:MAG: pyruvate kinase [Clostridia bacterium]|nr:pyruvate kinase [Clostridia bacterium]
MRKTKIICTVGPACEDEETLTKLCLAGMNVARLNFSHGDHAQHLDKINTIKRVREKLNLPIAIMLDTKGPEYRIQTFQNGSITLKEGDTFTFTTEDVEGDQTKVSVSYKGLMQDLRVGDTVLLNNGLIRFTVNELTDTEAICKVETGGVLSNRKSMSFPNKVLRQKFLSEQDKEDIRFGIENDVDFIACSFVSSKQDLLDVHEYLKSLGSDGTELIAKIENRAGVENIEEICTQCSGIMVARGDLGVEIPFEEVPGVQKKLIETCRMLGKRVITATEMLETMMYNSRPTRAEISDVANAVFDGSSAITLSGETAAGKYPELTVKTMAKIAEQAESDINYVKRFITNEFKIKNEVDALSHATCAMAINLHAKAIVTCTHSGVTARMVSRFRCPIDIVGFTTNEKTWRKLALSWGVIPVMTEEFSSTDVLFYEAKRTAKEVLKLKKKDFLVITGGIAGGSEGSTDLIKVEKI